MTDVFTQHWLDQGGSDPITQHWSDMHDAAGEEPGEDTHEGNDRRNRDDLDSDTRQAMDEVKARDADREDWDSSREHRDWLESRYPDTKLDTYARGMLDWHRKFQTDPYAAKEEWVRTWARMPPFHHKPKAAASKSEPPEGTPERWRGGWQRDLDVQAAYREAVKDKADRDGYATTGELRQQVKQATGLTLNQFLEKCRAIDAASLDDPVGVANRFALFSGAPATEAQAAELQHQANAGARVAQAQGFVDQVVQSGQLPGLGRPEIDNAVANVLNDPNFPRSGDHFLDLRNAHDIALKQLAAGHVPANTAAPDPARQAAADEAVQWAQEYLPRYREVEHLIPDILQNPAFRRSDNLHVDLEIACEVAKNLADAGYQGPPTMDAIRQQVLPQVLEQERARSQREAAARAKLAKRASRSVSGAPSPGASEGRRDSNNSVAEDAAAAWRSLSSRA